eukprot:Sspe_Gene.64014::Locus_37357_Transcript_1_1_Confidence_1.000_Length_1090::g.64014::m.64014
MAVHDTYYGAPEPPLLFGLWTQVGFVVCILFLSLSLASGLYYLAELAEEYCVMAKKILRWSVQLVVVVEVILLVLQEAPWYTCLVGIIAHLSYAMLLSNYPFAQLTSPSVVLSVVLFVIDNYLWFSFFVDYSTPHFSVAQVAGYFSTCVWPVPFGLFITLSDPSQGLPGGGTITDQGQGFMEGRKRRGFLSIMDTFLKKPISTSAAKAM